MNVVVAVYMELNWNITDDVNVQFVNVKPSSVYVCIVSDVSEYKKFIWSVKSLVRLYSWTLVICKF